MNRRILWTLVALLSAVAPWLCYEQLPQRLATHFNSRGVANGWMSKDGYFLFWSVYVLGINGFLLLLHKYLIDRVHFRWINIPNKKYWAATEPRRLKARQVAKSVLVDSALFMNFIFLFVTALILQENLPQRPQWIAHEYGILTILLSTMTFVLVLFFKFRKLKQS